MKEQYWFFPLFFFCDFNIITKTSCGEVNTKDRNSFKRILTSLFIRLYKNNPSHRISERKKKIDKNWSCKFASFKNTPSKQESIDHKKLLTFISTKSLSNNPKIISVITSNCKKKRNLFTQRISKKERDKFKREKERRRRKKITISFL